MTNWSTWKSNNSKNLQKREPTTLFNFLTMHQITVKKNSLPLFAISDIVQFDVSVSGVGCHDETKTVLRTEKKKVLHLRRPISFGSAVKPPGTDRAVTNERPWPRHLQESPLADGFDRWIAPSSVCSLLYIFPGLPPSGHRLPRQTDNCSCTLREPTTDSQRKKPRYIIIMIRAPPPTWAPPPTNPRSPIPFYGFPVFHTGKCDQFFPHIPKIPRLMNPISPLFFLLLYYRFRNRESFEILGLKL